MLLKWFRADDEEDHPAALRVEALFRAGELSVIGPPLLFIEVLNVAARRWRWQPDVLTQLAASLDSLSFSIQQPSLREVAKWTGRGLTAYDASYVALAEARGSPVITADAEILAVAGPLGEPIASYRR